jgi:DNA-binding NarL/FixJ family response regulator
MPDTDRNELATGPPLPWRHSTVSREAAGPDRPKSGIAQWNIATRPKPLRLLLITEIRFLGDALAAVLEREPAAAIVTHATASEALRFIAEADAALVDAAHPEGLPTVRRLRAIAPHLPIIACAVRESDDEIIRWAEAGVTGYLPNTLELGQIGSVVAGILDGEQICSGRAAAALLRRVAAAGRLGTAGPGAGGDAFSSTRHLTRRERQIAELIAAGLGDKHIARRLDISVATTKTHVHNLLGKLQLRQRTEVAAALPDAGDDAARQSRIV